MISRVLRMSGFELAVRVDERYARPLRALRSVLRPMPSRSGAAPVAGDGTDGSPEAAALVAQVKNVQWYHTMDLGHGVVTPGFFDHGPTLQHYHLPERLAGQRVLDVATYNGFWAFEFERRGAAEVIATDIETMANVDLAPRRRANMTAEELRQQTGAGFAIAHAAYRSRVRREIVDVYDLGSERLGTFDLVMCSDLLLHLTNPIRALQRIRSVTRGSAYISDMYDPHLDHYGPAGLMHYRSGMNDYVWWTFSLSGLQQMIQDAGFSRVTVLDRFSLLPAGMSAGPPHVIFKADA
jgi:tRNA (mo5U34)-methyltransferase